MISPRILNRKLDTLPTIVFANCEIKNVEDTVKLQKDIDRLGSWVRKWGMRFQPVKCNMMQLTNKWTRKIQAY